LDDEVDELDGYDLGEREGAKLHLWRRGELVEDGREGGK